MRTAFATRVGVSISQVELSLAAASVSATYRTYSTSQAAMAQVQEATVKALGDRVDVQAMLRSIADLRDSTVESDPAIDTEVDNSSNSGLVIGAAIGGAVLVVLVAVRVRRSKAEPKNEPVPTPPTLTPVSSSPRANLPLKCHAHPLLPASTSYRTAPSTHGCGSHLPIQPLLSVHTSQPISQSDNEEE